MDNLGHSSFYDKTYMRSSSTMNKAVFNRSQQPDLHTEAYAKRSIAPIRNKNTGVPSP